MCFIALALLGSQLPAFSAELTQSEIAAPRILTNAASVRELTPPEANRRYPVRLRGVVTFYFDTRSCFVQDESAGIYIGNGSQFPAVNVGDIVTIEGVSDAGDYAPIVKPSTLQAIGHTNLPPPHHVSFEDLMTGSEDSQWVEVEGLVRAVHDDPGAQPTFEMVSGGGRLTLFTPSSMQSNLAEWVDSRVRVRGVCGTWFNRLRQLFGVRLMVPRPEDLAMIEPAGTNAVDRPVHPIGDLLRFAPHAAHGHRMKVAATVVLQQPGRALFVQDDQYGLYAHTRQSGALHPGDRVELVGFPDTGEYTPILKDSTWSKIGSGPEPAPTLISPDQALGGLQDSRLVSIEGRLLDYALNYPQTILVLEAGGHIFTAHLDTPVPEPRLRALQNDSRLRITGVCRIEVGDDWRAGPDWRAKSFRILMRSPGDVQVLKLPPWWTLGRLLWAVGILAGIVLGSLAWVTLLHRKVAQQTTIIRKQLDTEATLKERFQDLFESANDMVYTHDLSGRITSINKAGEQLLGRPRAAIYERNLLEFIVEDQRPAAAQWLEDIVDGTVPATVEWDFLASNGERRRLEISTRLIDHEGRQIEVEGVGRDVTERRRLEKEILEVSTREQHRIGHDLHDGVCQHLAGISFLSDSLASKLDELKRPEAAEAHKITELVNTANKQTRSVARGLFPIRLEENGLESALEELTEHAVTLFGKQCEFTCDMPFPVRDHAMAHHLYFIAHEAILNAVRHGNARSIHVTLAANADRVGTLLVQDDGAGFLATADQARGMGIRIMKYRARTIGGRLQIRPRPHGGTEVLCHFSCDSEQPTAVQTQSGL